MTAIEKKRSEAAKKAWVTIRKNKKAASARAKKGWKARRKNAK